MTFDLFSEPGPPATVPTPAPAAAPCNERIAYPMEPIGLNRWSYRGEVIVFDSRRAEGSPLGRWRTVEGIGLPVLHSDDRAAVCRGIDARLDAGCSP
ncbi:hypothetical protein ABL840_26965 [Variovorax sp. NFACC27]|uniref:hypothetical protein n=1 Tax=unclassified Variovorax TaxID=663243 RepID=UPI00089BDABA|nr:hypothetical protein SAMN03159371_03656 [Variovorax sp. NFACC28]SEG77791.1 hypothetical protein SAMN03159365_03735 [Variovorax sp. NFACC29]SFC96854.1 hypothetical protein SAMN03159379_03687 [Variovorax sp. NFACC26]SFG09777.1 hypothetical protein SAMN03159447_01796 [Variovorax sp. NFACC27]